MLYLLSGSYNVIYWVRWVWKVKKENEWVEEYVLKEKELNLP